MENNAHGPYYRMVFVGIVMLVLLALSVFMVWGTVSDFRGSGLALSIMLVAFTGIAFLPFREAFKDIRRGVSTDAGTVNRKGEYFIGVTCEMPVTRESFDYNQEFQASKDDQELEFAKEMSEFYSFADREFKVSREIYNWLSPGDKVIITYWPHTRILTRVDKVEPRLK